MIDLHLHVLPDVDDGASSENVSRTMLEILARMGFQRVVATPHLMQPLTREYHLETTTALELIRPIATQLGITLELGYEHMLSPDITERLKRHEPSTLAGSSAVLVELPFIGWPQHTASTLFDLRTAGYRPVLAHPERYVEVHKNLELALAVGEQGSVLQVTSGALAGLYGKTVERSARKIVEIGLERGIAMVLSTDAHSDGQRLVKVPDGISWIRKQFNHGDLVVQWMSEVVPTHLLASSPIPTFQQWAHSKPHNSSINGLGDQEQPQVSGGWRRKLGLGSQSNG